MFFLIISMLFLKTSSASNLRADCYKFSAIAQSKGNYPCMRYREILPNGICGSILKDSMVALDKPVAETYNRRLTLLFAGYKLLNHQKKTLANYRLSNLWDLLRDQISSRNLTKNAKIASLFLRRQDLWRNTIVHIHKCFRHVKWLLCHFYYPACFVSESGEKILTRPCYESCINRLPGQCNLLNVPFNNVIHTFCNISNLCSFFPKKDQSRIYNCQFDATLNNSEKTFECYNNNALSYQGFANTTINKRKCLKWDQNILPKHLYPSLSENYCRNPQGYGKKPWCYIGRNGSWEYCSIKKCKLTKNDGDMSVYFWLLLILFVPIICLCCCAISQREATFTNVVKTYHERKLDERNVLEIFQLQND